MIPTAIVCPLARRVILPSALHIVKGSTATCKLERFSFRRNLKYCKNDRTVQQIIHTSYDSEKISERTILGSIYT